MELAVSPEPTAEERAAIELAVDRVLRDPTTTAGAWWGAGVKENTGADEEEDV